jgi:hypothetical protein
VRLSLQIEELCEDRVRLIVSLRPECDDADIEGVAVELVGCGGEAIGARLMLPLSGRLHGPMSLKTELRATHDLGRGCRIRGIVWHAGGKVEASCPCEPSTSLETYMLGGRVCMRPYSHLDIPSTLSTDERTHLVHGFPWIETYGERRRSKPVRVIEEQPDDLVDDITSCYGLCPEDAAFIKELFEDEDEWPCQGG